MEHKQYQLTETNSSKRSCSRLHTSLVGGVNLQVVSISAMQSQKSKIFWSMRVHRFTELVPNFLHEISLLNRNLDLSG